MKILLTAFRRSHVIFGMNSVLGVLISVLVVLLVIWKN